MNLGINGTVLPSSISRIVDASASGFLEPLVSFYLGCLDPFLYRIILYAQESLNLVRQQSVGHLT